MDEPIRVLNIVGRMGPGGIETLIMGIYRNIDRNKVQFDFLTHKEAGGAYEEEIKKLGGRIYRMPVLRNNFTNRTYYWRIFNYKSELKRFFKNHPEYHVVHGHMTNTASIYMPIARKCGKATCLIAHSHLTQARPGLAGKVTNILQRKIPSLATDYFACSEMAAHWFYPQSFIDSGKVKIIKNGVDPKRFYFDENKRGKIRKEMNLENKIVIGNVARFKTEKNHLFQVEIFEKIHLINPNTVLMLVGDGELMQAVRDKVVEKHLEKSVMFLGNRNDVPDLLLAMDMFLLPSLYEGLPVVAIEAQASGLPVITSTGVTRETDITGNVEFLELSQGPEYWANAVLRKVDNFSRHDMFSYIQKNGYDITETARWLQDFYLRKHNN